MNSLKITIKPTSSFVTPLHSDTLFGSFCWLLRDIKGESFLLKCLRGNTPFILFSNAFPQDCLPKPVIDPVVSEPITNEDEYTEYKRQKKAPFVKAGDFIKERKTPLDQQVLSGILKNDLKIRMESIRVTCNAVDELTGDGICTQKQMEIIRVTRNAIDRRTGRVAERQLYTLRETFYNAQVSLIIYVKFDPAKIDEALVTKVLELLGTTGIGKDKNVGKGKFSVKQVRQDPEELGAFKEANGFVSLSRGVPHNNDCKLYFGKTATKFSKHGGELAVKGKPFKNPVQLYVEGSTFYIKEPLKPYYGRLLPDVGHPEQVGHVHSGTLFPLFVTLPVLEENTP